MNLENKSLLEGKTVGNLVSGLIEIDKSYQQSEEMVAQEESRNQTLVGMLRDQVMQSSKQETVGKQL